MTIKLVRVGILLLFTGGLACPLLLAQTVPVAISVTVAKPPKEKHATPPPAPAPVVEDRLLEIALKNTNSQTLTNLVVKYWLLVRDVISKDVTISVTDSSTLTLRPFIQAVVTSTVAKCDYTPRTGTPKPVPAKGNKFYGYGVQVLEGGKIASQTYEPTDAQSVI